MKRRFIFCVVLIAFVANMALPYGVNAQMIAPYGLPQPQQLLNISKPYSYPVLKGIKINPDNPVYLEFIIDAKDRGNIDRQELSRLVSYFLACLTIPEQDLWVNLSPYEQNRITSEKLAQTDLGKDMLGEDYILKQLASSLTYPDSDAGKKYWQGVSGDATFNKIWIVPNKALIYEHNGIAVIKESSLKAMMDTDFTAMQQNNAQSADNANIAAFKKNIFPLIENEINKGEHFARLRQIHNAFLLATWFKKKLKDSAYRYYIDQSKVKGIDLKDTKVKENIYNLYVEAFKKGAYDYIKKEYTQNKISKHRYFSGGVIEKDQGTIVKDDPWVASIPVDAGVEVIPQGLNLGQAKGVNTVSPDVAMMLPLAIGLIVRQSAQDGRASISNHELANLLIFYSGVAIEGNYCDIDSAISKFNTSVISGYSLEYLRTDRVVGKVWSIVRRSAVLFSADSRGSLGEIDSPMVGEDDADVTLELRNKWLAAAKVRGKQLPRRTFLNRSVSVVAVEDSYDAPMPEGKNVWHYLDPVTMQLLLVTRRGLPEQVKEDAINKHEPWEVDWQLKIYGLLNGRQEGRNEKIQFFLKKVTVERIAHTLASAQERKGQPELIPYDLWQIKQIVQDRKRLERIWLEDRTMHYDWVEFFFDKATRTAIIKYDQMFLDALKQESRKCGIKLVPRAFAGKAKRQLSVLRDDSSRRYIKEYSDSVAQIFTEKIEKAPQGFYAVASNLTERIEHARGQDGFIELKYSLMPGVVRELNRRLDLPFRVSWVPARRQFKVTPKNISPQEPAAMMSVTGSLKSIDAFDVSACADNLSRNKKLYINWATGKIYRHLLRKIKEQGRNYILFSFPKKWKVYPASINAAIKLINAMPNGRLKIEERGIGNKLLIVSYRKPQYDNMAGFGANSSYRRIREMLGVNALKQTDVPQIGSEDVKVPDETQASWLGRAQIEIQKVRMSTVRYTSPAYGAAYWINDELVQNVIIDDSPEDPMPEGINAWNHYYPGMASGVSFASGVLLTVVRRGLSPEVKFGAANFHEPYEVKWQVTVNERKDELLVQDFLFQSLNGTKVTLDRIAHSLASADERKGKKELIAYDKMQIEEIVKDPARLAQMLAEKDRTMQHEWVEYFMGPEARAQMEAYDAMYYAELVKRSQQVNGGIALTSQTADIRTDGDLNVKMPGQLAKEFEASDGVGFKIVFIGR